jgi:hypothetical protein
MNRNARLVFSVWIGGVASVATFFPLAAPATAGQGGANPAGITGQITDGTGAVLPGVSDERGDYRLSPLPIGLYTVCRRGKGLTRDREGALC